LKETADPRETGLAGWRDASFYAKPGAATRYHVLLRGVGQTDLVAGCGTRGPFFDSGAIQARDVPEVLRCEREGCGQRWPK
jgi:hypothetical protein